MSDESSTPPRSYIETGIDPAQRTRPAAVPPFKRMLDAIPPRAEETHEDPSAAIGAHAAGEAMKRSEARRDAVLAVALAIKRRGGNPLTDWTTQDTDTAYAIAEQLTALG